MDYKTSSQMAEIWNISQRRVAVLCAQNRISGAKKVGKTWLIPSDCEKPTDIRHETNLYHINDQMELYVTEPVNSYSVKTELMLNPSLVQESKAYFAKYGKTLSEGINEYLKDIVSRQKKDCRSSYPKGFFNLFGSAPNLDFPDNINDLVPEEVEL